MNNNESFNSFKKSPHLSSKYTTYFDSYDHFFKKYKNQIITFVEIGVLNGGSLFMWRDYFGEKARIIGVDLNPEAKKWEKEGFEIFIGSQSDENFWKNFIGEVGNIDIVLDDGGHTYSQQIISADFLIPHIKDGGLIVVEDTHTSYCNGFGDIRFSFIEYVKEKIDKINLRFYNFPKDEAEWDVWSIEIVESMVAFKVNKKASNIDSTPIVNIKSNFPEKDFRYEDKNALKSVEDRFKNGRKDKKISLVQLEELMKKIKIEAPDTAVRLKRILE